MHVMTWICLEISALVVQTNQSSLHTVRTRLSVDNGTFIRRRIFSSNIKFHKRPTKATYLFPMKLRTQRKKKMGESPLNTHKNDSDRIF